MKGWTHSDHASRRDGIVALGILASAALAATACTSQQRPPESPAPATTSADTTAARTGIRPIATADTVATIGQGTDPRIGATDSPPPSPTAARMISAEASRLADSLVRLMTLEEKIGQLIMSPVDWDQTGPRVTSAGDQAVREGKVGSFLNYWGANATRRMQRVAVEESRLKIPLLFAYDVIHGWRTIYPVGLATAASFDTALVREAARMAAVESSAYGVHWTFAPMIDVARDARWGRVVEGNGESPLLNAAMGAAQVRGFQGTDLSDSTSILATAKHFVAYGAAEGGRDYDVADISERTLWETYLPPFEAAVEAGVGSVMASFNEIGGTPVHASRYLIQNVLRDRWGFGGVLVSDWTGIDELLRHGVGPTRAEAARRALEAGVDIEMSSDLYRTDLPALVRDGRVPMAQVDSAVHRVIRTKHALGLFRDPYRGADTARERAVTLTPEHRALARRLAGESIVLLENREVGGRAALPLRAELRSVAMIGPLADDRRSTLGSWAGAGRAEDAVTPLDAIRRRLPNARVAHARGVPIDSMNTAGIAEAVRVAQGADAVVLVLGEHADMSGEAASRASIELPGAQLQLAQAVTRAVRRATPGKPVVAVLMNGRPLAVPWLADSVHAVVESWYLGVEHGNALADVLFGDVNPSGRLPITMPRATGQVPIYHNRKLTGRPPQAENKYTSKYLDVPWTPQWPFGHGLSYTRFTHANLRASAESITAGDSIAVQVDVTNAGDREGTEVVQLYLRDDAASVTRPVRELRRWARVPLRPGETRTVRFTLGADDMALYGLDMRRVVEPGTFTIWAGGSSAATLERKFTVRGDTLVVAPAPPRMR